MLNYQAMKKTIRYKSILFLLIFILVIIVINESLQISQQAIRKSSLIPKQESKEFLEEKLEYNTNQILYEVIDRYRIISMLDLSCDIIVSSLLKNLSIEFNRKFSYHGVCNNDTIVEILQDRNETERKFSKFDFSKDDLPPGYELIFLDYISKNQSMIDVINWLYNFAYTKKSVYLLVSSRITNQTNETLQTNSNIIENGTILNLDLTNPPFNLKKYVQKYENNINEQKYLLLYELSEMRKVNFKKMKENAELFMSNLTKTTAITNYSSI